VEGDTRLDPGTWNFLLPGPEKIGYVRITSFSERTAKELERALDTLTKQKMQGLIVDVRENPGGLLTVACEICDLFLKKGETIVTIRHRNGSDEKTASGNGPYTGIPMAVIVNNDSASASEIFAACMQDHHRAAIVGQRTHGKGTVQQIIDLEKDCGAIRLTIASYWRPSGHNIQRKHGAPESEEWGVQPDPGCKIVVDGEERVKLMLWRMRRDTQLSGDASNDADDYRAADIQLKKAIECVEKEIK
jgi:carboxyl-terminal processing protease